MWWDVDWSEEGFKGGHDEAGEWFCGFVSMDVRMFSVGGGLDLSENAVSGGSWEGE